MPTATVTMTINKGSLQNCYDKIVTEMPDNTVLLLDDLGEICKEKMDIEAPSGTGNLISQHTVEDFGTYARYICSEVEYFDPLVGGHNVFGPIFSDLQRRWWFWYLKNELGGEYENKTDGHYEGDNYPMRAYYDAQAEMDSRMQDYLTAIGS
ncbi:MAG: hypothetical protein K8E24_013445 [Methanobacterium paludis]|nr:hypothetical protein [Methanobacterium paludis]